MVTPNGFAGSTFATKQNKVELRGRNVTVNDNIVFPRNKDVYNIILSQSFGGSPAHSGEPWKKLHTQYGYEEGTFPWFPQLTIQKPTSSGYFNVLSKDGTEIYEYIDDPKQNMQRKAEGRYIGKNELSSQKQKIR